MAAWVIVETSLRIIVISRGLIVLIVACIRNCQNVQKLISTVYTKSRLNKTQSTYDYWRGKPVLGEWSQLLRAQMLLQYQKPVLFVYLAPIVVLVAMPGTNITTVRPARLRFHE